jgi:hypothetical protein
MYASRLHQPAMHTRSDVIGRPGAHDYCEQLRASGGLDAHACGTARGNAFAPPPPLPTITNQVCAGLLGARKVRRRNGYSFA